MIDYTLLQAGLLGLIEAATEFLPVSSTGHLILLVDLIGFQGPPGRVFEVVIQLGAVLAICVLYMHKLWQVATGLPTDPGARRFVLAILLAFLPAAVVGVLIHDIIKTVLFDPLVVACALIVGGVAILLIERFRPEPRHAVIETFPLRTALGIGAVQCLAMVPGVSRSGATIMGALLMGVERKTAAEFSFFLAIPTMLGATVYDLFKNRDTLDFGGGLVIAVGFVTAFIGALVVVRWLLGFLSRHGFTPFAWYRIALGSIILVVLALR
ncbi:undecaprenyl-diphosphate phosphatase [Marinivivus vitaminiproducens]|uniref:undecaprenyl-diphosphate phosphatase n=1 Tax=Marinivivus vitaminiproducens TaxID=3035935 RepID=UPI0027AB4B4C|nr:undecaprenyl-diphosphate phosphatase [Geminicoccaceae bacterium SCSIO 64248]